MFKLVWSLRHVFLVGILVVGYFGINDLLCKSRPDAGIRRTMARDLARQVSLDLNLPRERIELAIPPVNGDCDRMLTIELREWLGRQNAVIEPWHWLEKILPKRYASKGLSQPEAAMEYGKIIGKKYVLWASVESWQTYPREQTQLIVFVKLIDTESESTVSSRQFSWKNDNEERLNSTLLASEATSPCSSAFGGCLFWIWLAICFVSPLTSTPLINHFLSNGSPSHSVIFVFGFSLIQILTGYFMWLRFDPTYLNWISLFVILIGWLAYLEAICRWLESRRFHKEKSWIATY